MGMLMPLEVGSACGKFELISAFSLLMPKLPWVLSIDLALGPVDQRKFPEGPAGLFLWKEHSFFLKVEHSRQSSPVFQTSEPRFSLSLRLFHRCWTLVGRSSLLISTCLSYWRLQGTSSGQETTTASLFTFAARKKCPLTCRPRV